MLKPRKEYSKKYQQESITLSRKLLDDYRVINEADLLNSSMTPYGEQIMVEKHPIINLQSHHPLSIQRDQIYIDGQYQSGSTYYNTGSSNVNNDGKWHQIVNATPDATRRLESAQSGVYISGYWAEIGIGVAVSQSVDSNARVYWGYYDEYDGFGWMKTGNDLYIFVKYTESDGSTEEVLIGQNPNQPLDTTTDKSGWNVDQMNGSSSYSSPPSNPTLHDLDTHRGHMYQCRFTHYGFGMINFYVNHVDTYGNEEKILLHKYEREGSPVLNNPNLPVSAHIETNSSFSGFEALNIGGRQMSILGNYVPLYRYTSEINKITLAQQSDATAIQSRPWIPVITAKQDYPNIKGVQALINKISIITDYSLQWGVFINCNLNQSNFIVPTNTTSNTFRTGETSMLFDYTATSVTDGYQLATDIISAGKNDINLFSSDDLLLPIPRGKWITLAVKNLTNNNASLTSILSMREEY